MESTVLSVLRGRPGLPPLKLEMGPVYMAEQRLQETKVVNPATAPELRGYFNETCNLTTKYIAWVTYEILEAEKQLQLAKAEVIIDKLPVEIAKLKESGMKDNADYREAIVARDSQYQDRLNTLNALRAVKELLNAKFKTFERAYWDCRDIASARGSIAATPNLNFGDNHTEHGTVMGTFKIGG